MHALALPLLEDLIPHLLAHPQPNGTPERAGQKDDIVPTADERLAELMAALATSLRACAPDGSSAEASAVPALPMINLVTLLCKLLGAISVSSAGYEVRAEGRALAC